MEPLKAALERLARAADRLAVAAETREARFVRREQDLAVALQEARHEQARVSGAAGGLSERLDQIIARLEAVLDDAAPAPVDEAGAQTPADAPVPSANA